MRTLSPGLVVATPTMPPPPNVCPPPLCPEIGVNGKVVPEFGLEDEDCCCDPSAFESEFLAAPLSPARTAVPPLAFVSAASLESAFMLETGCPKVCAPGRPELNAICTSTRCSSLNSFPNGSL